jgi:hypothetical protein
MRERAIKAAEVRLPAPVAGEAILVTKHANRVKVVLLHPDDYERLGRLLDLFGEEQPFELQLTETALAAHRLGEAGEDAHELDLESLERALSG